jgi:hypothetical protein
MMEFPIYGKIRNDPNHKPENVYHPFAENVQCLSIFCLEFLWAADVFPENIGENCQ